MMRFRRDCERLPVDSKRRRDWNRLDESQSQDGMKHSFVASKVVPCRKVGWQPKTHRFGVESEIGFACYAQLYAHFYNAYRDCNSTAHLSRRKRFKGSAGIPLSASSGRRGHPEDCHLDFIADCSGRLTFREAHLRSARQPRPVIGAQHQRQQCLFEARTRGWTDANWGLVETSREQPAPRMTFKGWQAEEQIDVSTYSESLFSDHDALCRTRRGSISYRKKCPIYPRATELGARKRKRRSDLDSIDSRSDPIGRSRSTNRASPVDRFSSDSSASYQSKGSRHNLTTLKRKLRRDSFGRPPQLASTRTCPRYSQYNSSTIIESRRHLQLKQSPCSHLDDSPSRSSIRLPAAYAYSRRMCIKQSPTRHLEYFQKPLQSRMQPREALPVKRSYYPDTSLRAGYKYTPTVWADRGQETVSREESMPTDVKYRRKRPILESRSSARLHPDWRQRGRTDRSPSTQRHCRASVSTHRSRLPASRRPLVQRRPTKKKDEQLFSPEFVIEDDEEGHLIYQPYENITNRYQIIRTLGEGTFGRVVKCKDFYRKSVIALKIIKNVPKYRDAAMLEIKVLQYLKECDPNGSNLCVRMDDWFNYHGHICLSFDILGPSVFEFLKVNNFSGYPMRHIRHISYQVCHAVAFLHANRLTHTDLKPENILFVRSSHKVVRNYSRGRPKRIIQCSDVRLIDFGSATFDDDHHSTIVSTRHYRALEVILEIGWSHPCDVWSIGCIIFELYTGFTMFQTHDNREHLTVMEYSLGKIPPRLNKKSRHTDYFTASGELIHSRRIASKKHLFRSLLNYRKDRRSETQSLFDLVARMLVYDPEERIRLHEVINHDYFGPLAPHQRLSGHDRLFRRETDSSTNASHSCSR